MALGREESVPRVFCTFQPQAFQMVGLCVQSIQDRPRRFFFFFFFFNENVVHKLTTYREFRRHGEDITPSPLRYVGPLQLVISSLVDIYCIVYNYYTKLFLLQSFFHLVLAPVTNCDKIHKQIVMRLLL